MRHRLPGRLRCSRFFYLFAADDIGGGAWDGSVFMCTRDETFTIFGVEDCLARGYERTGFFEVDTQNRSDWMLQLTDADERRTRPDEDVPDETIMLEGDVPAGRAMRRWKANRTRRYEDSHETSAPGQDRRHPRSCLE